MTLKGILDNWDAYLRSGRKMVTHLQQLGITDQELPSGRALQASCLALQSPESLELLRSALVLRERDLLDQGVLHSGQQVRALDGGAMVVLHHVADKLHLIAEQMDAMLERAYNFSAPETPVAGHPTIRIGADRVQGYRYQMADLLVRLGEVDRLLVYAQSQEAPRILLLPPATLRISVPIVEGGLLLYAENSLGAAQIWLHLREVNYV
jgi:hypothetical protein